MMLACKVLRSLTAIITALLAAIFIKHVITFILSDKGQTFVAYTSRPINSTGIDVNFNYIQDEGSLLFFMKDNFMIELIPLKVAWSDYDYILEFGLNSEFRIADKCNTNLSSLTMTSDTGEHLKNEFKVLKIETY